METVTLRLTGSGWNREEDFDTSVLYTGTQQEGRSGAYDLKGAASDFEAYVLEEMAHNLITSYHRDWAAEQVHLPPVVQEKDLYDLHILGTALDDDPVSPNHYKFPGGAEVIQISEWLSANGAQALQYVARATRLDGKQKGSREENEQDLRKAIWFLERELDRITTNKEL